MYSMVASLLFQPARTANCMKWCYGALCVHLQSFSDENFSQNKLLFFLLILVGWVGGSDTKRVRQQMCVYVSVCVWRRKRAMFAFSVYVRAQRRIQSHKICRLLLHSNVLAKKLSLISS